MLRHLIAVATIACLVAVPTPASAEAEGNTAEAIAAVIDAAVPDEREVVQPQPATSDSVTFDASNAEVSLEASHPGAVAWFTPVGVRVAVGMPLELDATDGSVASDGTVVFADVNETTHGAVQGLDDGSIRIQTILESEASPNTFTCPFDDGVTPVLRADGGADLLVEIDSIVFTVGAIEPPWATDADGHDVATHYTVEGNALVQHVAHGSGDAYPVTADPTFSLGWWAYLHFNRAETATIASRGWGATALTALCTTAASPLGPAVAALMGGLCGAQAGAIVYTAGVANNSKPKACLVLKYRPPVLLGSGTLFPETYRDSRCI